MHHIVVLAAPVAGVLVAVVAAGLVARRATRRRVALAAEQRPEPRSVVHVLVDEHELRAAVERASRFERGVAEALESRAARYESLLGESLLGATAPDLRAVRTHDAASDRQSRPA